MTPKFSNEVDYLKPQERYFHSSRSQKSYQTDRENKETPQLKKICNICRKNGLSISRCFKRKTVKNHQVNSESRQQYDAQSKTDTQRMFEVFFKSNQNLPRKVPLTLMFQHINNITVLPDNGFLEIKPILRQNDPLHLTIELVKTELLTTVLDLSSQTIVTIFFTIHILQKSLAQNITVTPPQQMSTKKFRKSSRSSAPFLFVFQIVDNLKEFFQVAFPD